jgi:hypothetical protein
MNPSTGHLVSDFDMIPPDERKSYVPIPATLTRAAARKLGKNSEATVSLTSGGKLAAWAKEQPGGKAAQRRLRQMARQMARQAAGKA